MEKKRNNLLKRVAAGALSVLTVAAYTMPADVVGKFSGNIGIVAQAAGETISVDDIHEGDILTAGTTISFAGYEDIGIDFFDGDSSISSADKEFTLASDCFVKRVDPHTGIDEETNEEYKIFIYVSFYAIREANTFVKNNGVYTSNNQEMGYTMAYYSFVSDSAQTMNWNVDSEEKYDYLYVYVNDVRKVEASGSNVSGSLELAAGDNVRVIYLKDYTSDEGSDCASFSLTGDVQGYINNGDGTHSIEGDEAKEAHHFTEGYVVTPVASTSGYTFTESGAFPGSWKNNNSRLENDSRDNSTAKKSWNVTVPEGQKLYIYYLISSESGCDYLDIYDYNDLILSGESGETEGFIELAAGEHSITAEYKKDGSDAYGMDSAYIRFVPECTECGANDSTMKSLLTFDGDIYTDIAVTGTDTSKVQSAAYGVNSMYWCQNTATIYSNVRLYADEERATLQEEEGYFTYGGNQYFFKYTLTVIDPSVGKNIVIWNNGIDEDYSEFIDIDNDNWRYDEEYNMYFTTYDGKIPDLSEFTITPSSSIDNEDEIKRVQDILDSPDTVKKLIWNSPGVYCGAPCEGMVVIYNPEIGVKAKHVEVNFEKRKVTVTPAAGQSKVYGDDKLPEIECDIEQENGDRGILAVDIDKNFTPKFYAWDSDRQISASYSNANVGEYYYEIDNDFDDDGDDLENVSANYEFELPENCPTFAVVPKDISGYTLYVGKRNYSNNAYNQAGDYYERNPEVQFNGDFVDITTDLEGVDFLDNGKRISLDRDYIEYGGDVKKHSVGDYTLHAWGKGNYTGHTSANWSIVRESGDIIQYNGSKTYDGKDISDMFEIHDPNNEYEVRYSNGSEYINELSPDVGTYYVETWKGGERKDSKSFSIYTKHLRSSDIEFDFGDSTTIMTSADEWLEFPVEQISIFDKTANKKLELGEESGDSAKDYYVMPVKTKAPGVYKIEIVGKGNYKGYITTDWTVKSLTDDAVTLEDAVLKDGTKARFVLTPQIPEGYNVKAYGIIYDKTGAVTNAETAKSGLVLGGNYVTKTCTKTDGTLYGLNITPVEDKTIWAVGYMTLEKDGQEMTVYTEPKSAKVSELASAAISENINVDLADAVLQSGTKARFVLTPQIADGYTIDAYGIIYDKTGAVNNAEAAKNGLVLGGSYVTKTCTKTDGTLYGLNITPVEDNTIWAVGYITVSYNGVTKTIYTEPKSAKVSELVNADILANVSVDLADAVLQSGTKARFVLTPQIADGYTAEAYGIIYDKTGAVNNAEAAKNGLVLGGNYVTKTCTKTDGTLYGLNITPVEDNTIWAVGYITVSGNGVTKTIYTDPKSAKVSELQAAVN